MKLEPANIICPKCGNGNYMRHLIGKGVGKLDMKCINCNSYFNFDELYKQKIAEVVKPQTNYERLIGKTPEELAEFFAPRGCPWILEQPCPEGGTTCNKCWLDWLNKGAT